MLKNVENNIFCEKNFHGEQNKSPQNNLLRPYDKLFCSNIECFWYFFGLIIIYGRLKNRFG